MCAKPRLWRVLLTILGVAWLVAGASLATAHPLGNFSISHYTAIRLAPDSLELRYILDLAEIPTFQELQEAQLVAQEGHPSLPVYLAHRVEELRTRLSLEVDGKPLALTPANPEVIFPPGAGGLPTLKIGVHFRASFEAVATADAHELRYRDGNYPSRTGWKEIVAKAASGVMLLSSSVPERDRSHELSDYPTDLLNSPPQDVEAHVIFVAAAPTPVGIMSTPPAAPNHSVQAHASGSAGVENRERHPSESSALVVNRQHTPRNAFTELVATPQLGLGLVLVALAVAVGLGAFHALEPGHGKTVVAAYLVGSRGTAGQALLLGLTVTATHTAGVYALGAVTLLASRYVVPERLYPWLGVISGLIIAALGFSLVWRRSRVTPHTHVHEVRSVDTSAHTHAAHHHGLEAHAGHAHAHHAQHHSHAHAHPVTMSLRELLTLGVTGGMVPCPAALVVLLSALSLNRLGFGLLLIVAFSLGLATVLVAIGLLMVFAQRLMARFQGNGVLLTRWLPLTSATAITVFGIAIAVQALVTAGILQIRL